jgi:tRNA(Ile)-lysidine synthase
MQAAFTKHIQDKKLFAMGDKLLLAISGGVDSVVLAHLLKQSGAQFSLAHCNFKLRAKDSDEDERFCKHLAKQLGLEIYTKTFDVENYCKENKLSIQMAARDLRYAWFKELLSKHQFDYLLTAHHAGDTIETLFINLMRGTGIKGLKGISEKTEQLIRPLLAFTKEELISYATDHGIVYRQDKSNLDDKYERNFLRLNILPALEKKQPGLQQILLNNIRNFKEESEIVNAWVSEKLKGILSKKGNQIVLDKTLLKKEKHIRSILHAAIEPYGFNATQVSDIIGNINSSGLTGKIFLAPQYELLIDRSHLIIKPSETKVQQKTNIASLEDLKTVLTVKELKSFVVPVANELILDTNRLVFPLQIRTAIRGDKFRPFGMKGFKLLSDFFKDEKLNKFEKENCKLLVNGNGDIIWVMGYRSDDRYKVLPGETNLVKLIIT